MKDLKFYGDRIITGKDSLNYIKNADGKKIFIVVGGNSVFVNGTIDRVKEILTKADKEFKIFSGVQKNPDFEVVMNGVKEMVEYKPDTVLAMGGGSPIDAAKVMTLIYDNPTLLFDINNYQKITEKVRKTQLIAVPTTSGTGAEVTKAAVITFKEDNIKIGLKSEAFIPDIAILDYELTMTMPDNIVAETGMDALTHALESYINHNLDDISECLARGAIEGMIKYLPISYNEKTRESREKVHNFQSMAGMAFHNVGLGMAHGISHALGGKYNLGHGLLNGVLLPYVLKFNSCNEAVKEKLNKLSNYIGVEDIIDKIKELNHMMDIPSSIKELGIPKELFFNDFEELLEKSLQGSTLTNPVKVSKEDMKMILHLIYDGE